MDRTPICTGVGGQLRSMDQKSSWLRGCRNLAAGRAFLVAPQDRKEPSQRSEKLAGTNSISGQRIDGERRAAMEGVGGNWGREQSGSPG
jgi:hypothetical protein